VLRAVLLLLTVTLALVGCSSRTVVHPSPTASSSSRAPVAKTPGPSESPTAPASVAFIAHVHWTVTARGRQLQVVPTPAGRTDASISALQRAWAQVLADAPTANTPGMYDQFRCHWQFARIADPNKASWNLEPWRPAVGYAATVAAQCNPGGAQE
jgi:hypothetical protein